MKVALQNQLRERVFALLGQKTKKEVLAHFLSENYSRRTLYSIFKRYETGKDATGKKKPGRPPKLTSTQLQKLKKNAVGKRENLIFLKKLFVKT